MSNPYQDQHFLVDKTISILMVDSLKTTEQDFIIEIGTGNGELTKGLLKNNPKEFLGIEKDKELASKLQSKLKTKSKSKSEGSTKIQIINEDVLKLNLSQEENLKIISSLPYSLSTEIFQKIIKLNFKIGVFLSGKDFFELINNKETKLGFIISKLFKIKKLKEVPKEAFKPKPRVNSVLFSIEPKKIQDKLIKSLVLQDDKKIKNAIMNYYWSSGSTKNQSKDKISKLNLNEQISNKNIWQISNKEFLELIKNKF